MSRINSKIENESAISTFSSDVINKGYGRVSKGLTILCVFVACTSLFLFHTQKGLPCSELNNGEVHPTKRTSQKSFPFKGNNQPLSSHQDGKSFIVSNVLSLSFENWIVAKPSTVANDIRNKSICTTITLHLFLHWLYSTHTFL